MATTLEELQVLITAQTSDLRKELNNVKKDLGGLDKQAKESAASISKAFGAVKTALLALGIGKVIKDSISAASELEGAMAGLTSIVEGHGMSMQRANKFIQDYIKDGLVPLTNAVTAYKNLAARGYTEDQIQNVMSRLKDSAAFGRQASYTLGAAVETATEGLKNENSILVDNAGVTKNVAKMWEEYAKAHGKSYNQLTQQEKIQAEVNGIMQETQFQVGDAAKYADTYAGRLAALNKTLYDIKVSLGQAFMPIMNVILPLLQTLANAVAKVMAYVAQFMQALFGVAKGHQSQANAANKAAQAQVNVGDSADKAGKKAKKAAKEAKGAVLAFDEINQLPDKSSSSGADKAAGGADAGGIGAISMPDLETPDMNAVPEEIQQMVNKVKAILSKVFEPFRKAWDQYGPGVTKEFNRAIEGSKDLLQSFGKLLSSVWISGGSRFLENIVGLSLEIARLGLRIYNDFILPVVKWFVEYLNPETNKATKGILDGVNWLLEKLKEFVSYLAGDGFGYVQIALGALLGAFVALKAYEMVLGIIEFIKGVTVAARALFLVLAANPIGLVITAIGLLVGAFIAAYNNNENFRNTVDKLWSQIKTALIPVFESFKETVVYIWREILVPFNTFLANVLVAGWDAVTKAAKFLWNDILVPFGEFLKWLWNQVLSPLAKILSEELAIAFKYVSQVAQLLWDNILAPLADFLATVLVAAVKGIIEILTVWWKNIFKPFGEFLVSVFKPIIEGLVDVFVYLWHKVFEPIATFIGGVFVKTFENMSLGIKTIIKGLKEIFTGLIDFIVGVFTGNWGKAWEGVKTLFKGVFDSLYGIVKVPLNAIIDSINWVIDGLNKIQINTPDWIPGVGGKSYGIDIKHINKLARGGIVDSPQLAMIGEAGKEAVVPLENTSFVNTLASALGSAVMGAMQMSGGGQQAAHTSGDMVIQVDGVTLARVLNPYLSREQGRIGASIIQPI